jgi:hypothetical protein
MVTGDFGFTRDSQDTLAAQDDLNPLPRSVTRGDAFLLLDGDWQFAFDSEDRGLREQWYLEHGNKQSLYGAAAGLSFHCPNLRTGRPCAGRSSNTFGWGTG